MPDKAGSGGNLSSEDREVLERQIEELEQQVAHSEMTAGEMQAANAGKGMYVPQVLEVTGPHLLNLNEDPMLSGYIKHEFKAGMNKLGKLSSNPDINIAGLGIQDEHAFINV